MLWLLCEGANDLQSEELTLSNCHFGFVGVAR